MKFLILLTGAWSQCLRAVLCGLTMSGPSSHDSPRFMQLQCLQPLEKEMAAHSSIHAWKIPQTEETGRLQSMGS